ncbi:type VII secretion target [Mycolicibacterium thermoresistibile]
MGLSEPARVDLAALLTAADRYERIAERIDATVRTELSALTFDGALAGSAYTARGDALRSAVDEVVGRLRQWSRSAAAISAALRATASRYGESETSAAQRMSML